MLPVEDVRAAPDEQVQSKGPVCECPDPYGPGLPGVIWQGVDAPTLAALAELLAPVLWFSSDEPLLLRSANQAIPQPHPCDQLATNPVVYYQASDVVLRGADRLDGNGESDPRFFDKVDHFVLRFFFYYDEDRGLNPHAHDLESIEVLVYLDRSPDGCYRVRLERVEGLAHGLRWYSNILRVQRDTAFPLVVLVEEGKHASVPDRNADGVYTPGYDVNTRVNDAWGLRDVLGSSVLLGARYTANMSKPRNAALRLLPPHDAPVCRSQRRRVLDNGEHLGRYVLRPARGVPVCDISGPEPQRLRSMMRSHRFGSEWPVGQHDSDLARDLSDPETLFRLVSAVNARIESNRIGVAVQGPGLDFREFWVVPRGYASRGWSADLLITPSASRWVDWYIAAGVERFRFAGEDEAARVPHSFASELGVKFRVAAPGRTRWALLGYQFGGVRLGVRSSGFARLRHPRMIVELGAGAF
jgi:hypothetical protein